MQEDKVYMTEKQAVRGTWQEQGEESGEAENEDREIQRHGGARGGSRVKHFIKKRRHYKSTYS